MKISLLTVMGAGAVAAFSMPASAECIGTCGTQAPNGVVTAPPAYGPNYSYVSTDLGVLGAGQIAGVGGTNGSEFTTQLTAKAGDALNFYFNYVTSDGTTFADYGFAQLLNAQGDSVAYLFTARTTPSGTTSPGFGLPNNEATLTPGSAPIIPGAPEWEPLGGSSGLCWANGCGYTGWINSNYTIANAGDYTLRFGVSNFGDQGYHSGLAFAGVTVGGVPVPLPGVPEPSTWAMLLVGFGALGSAMRRRSGRVRAKLALT